MKKQLIIASLIACANFTKAQTWGGSGSTTGNTYRSGNVGIGNTSPADHLDITSNVTNGGITVTQTYYGSSCLTLNNTTSGGRKYVVGSTGVGNAQGAGHFSIYDYTGATDRFFIQGTSGNTGIGTVTPDYAKLQVVTPVYSYMLSPNTARHAGLFQANSSAAGTYIGARGTINNSVGSGFSINYGLVGEATCSTPTGNNTNYGVIGTSIGGSANYGGYFQATTGGSQNIGVYGEGSGATTNWAGYFQGNVYRSGTDNFTSDRKLKNNIKPLENAIDKIKLLKPSTYTFKTDDAFNKMNLPKGKQMGLIAQDLELVFPELVTEMAEIKLTDLQGKESTIPAFKSVQYISLIPVLIAGIQEQQKQIDELKKLLQATTTDPSAKKIGMSIDLSDKNVIVLNQNVPNPFAESTTISYNLPNDFAKAQLIFTTGEGKIIRTIDITSKGVGTLNVFANDLSSGIYTYSLVVDGKTIDTKKMIKE